MNKAELIDVVAKKIDGTKKEAEAAVNAFIESVEEALVKGDKVVVFKMKRRKDYRVKNGHRTHFTEVEVKSVNA